jgi:hypothetical protein
MNYSDINCLYREKQRIVECLHGYSSKQSPSVSAERVQSGSIIIFNKSQITKTKSRHLNDRYSGNIGL